MILAVVYVPYMRLTTNAYQSENSFGMNSTTNYLYRNYMYTTIILEKINAHTDVCTFQTHSSGAVIHFPSGGLPWKEHLYELEEELNIPSGQIKYAIFQDTQGSWRVSAVNVSPGSFDLRYVFL